MFQPAKLTSLQGKKKFYGLDDVGPHTYRGKAPTFKGAEQAAAAAALRHVKEWSSYPAGRNLNHKGMRFRSRLLDRGGHCASVPVCPPSTSRRHEKLRSTQNSL